MSTPRTQGGIGNNMSNLWLAMVTGLTTGGISCFAVQGGLLTSALASSKNEIGKLTKENSIVVFLIAKLLAHTILGFILGSFGAIINISTKFQSALQIFIGLYLLATAARLLNLHPIFRYFTIQPPKSFLKIVKKRASAQSTFTPAILGLLTVLIPCGVTQAMMILAIGSGNGFWGAGIMFFFVLGTSPVFFLIGLTAAELFRHKYFSTIAAVVIIILGITTINSGQLLRGSVHTLQNYWAIITGSLDEARSTKTAKVENGIQKATIYVANNGYNSDVDNLKINVPVKLTLITQGVRSCTRAFTIPGINISKDLPQDGTTVIEFTPTKAGRLIYTCSMGMYSGAFNIIN